MGSAVFEQNVEIIYFQLENRTITSYYYEKNMSGILGPAISEPN